MKLFIKKRIAYVFSLLATLMISGIGCEIPKPPPEQSEAGPPQPLYSEKGSVKHQQLEEALARRDAARSGATPPDSGTTDGASDTSDGTPATSDGATPDGNGKLVKAEPGVGVRQDSAAGFITTPINKYFSIRERIALRQVEDGLKKFSAQYDRKPMDYDEVFEKIIKPRNLRMPDLKPGDSYVYVPTEGLYGAVMVRQGK